MYIYIYFFYRESFTDLPLAFPGQDQSETSSKALAGGSGRLEKGKGKKSGLRSATTTTTTGESASQEENKDKVTLEQMTEYYLKPEKLQGDNKYDCQRCRGLQDGTRTMRVTSAPEYLILTLLRFAYNAKTHSRSKIFTDVSYPRSLQLPVWYKAENTNTLEHGNKDTVRDNGSSTKRSRTGTAGDDGDLEKDMERYALCSVIVHSGLSSECGHYYCYARHSIPVNHSLNTSISSDDDKKTTEPQPCGSNDKSVNQTEPQPGSSSDRSLSNHGDADHISQDFLQVKMFLIC